jgi:hypothetical protein
MNVNKATAIVTILSISLFVILLSNFTFDEATTKILNNILETSTDIAIPVIFVILFIFLYVSIMGTGKNTSK